MRYLVVHNGDDQATNFVNGLPNDQNRVGIIQAQFVNNDIAPATFQAVTNATGGQPTNLIWAGHGAGNNPRGTPLTNTAARIRARNFTQLFQILKPRQVIFFTCSAGRWVRRVGSRLLPRYTTGPTLNITLHALTVNLSGLLRYHVYGYLSGNQQPQYQLPLPAHRLESTVIMSHKLRVGAHPGLPLLPVHMRNRKIFGYTPAGYYEV